MRDHPVTMIPQLVAELAIGLIGAALAISFVALLAAAVVRAIQWIV